MSDIVTPRSGERLGCLLPARVHLSEAAGLTRRGASWQPTLGQEAGKSPCPQLSHGTRLAFVGGTWPIGSWRGVQGRQDGAAELVRRRFMLYGISIAPAGPGGDPSAMAELAAEAEGAGWDGIFLEDYIVYQGQVGTDTYDPWVTMAAMAVATRRVRLGTSVTPLPRRRPWKLASEALTLDHLSQGRVILGVGAGDDNDPGFSATAEPSPPVIRAQLLDEGLEIVTRLWTGKTSRLPTSGTSAPRSGRGRVSTSPLAAVSGQRTGTGTGSTSPPSPKPEPLGGPNGSSQATGSEQSTPSDGARCAPTDLRPHAARWRADQTVNARGTCARMMLCAPSERPSVEGNSA